MTAIILPKKTLQWLLENKNPPVRNLTTKFLLNKEPTESEKKTVNDYPPIKAILSSMKSDGSWNDSSNPYKKYTGAYWQIIFLCDLNADPNNRHIQKAIEHIFSYQLADGTFPHILKSKFGILCLTANLLRSCITFGFENDVRVQKGVKFISRHIIENKGVVCNPLYLLPDCQMALTKVLAMYASMNKLQNNTLSKDAIEIIKDKISENKILYYTPAGAKEYYKAIKGKKIAEIKEIKSRMLKDPENLKKIEAKKSWQKFGFPNSYTSDTLETLYWLAMIDPFPGPEYNDAISLVIQRMNTSGYWKNENMFRNPMLTEIEPKNTPSKWLTFRASFILKTYRELKFNT